jgi:GAF domain-containing protein
MARVTNEREDGPSGSCRRMAEIVGARAIAFVDRGGGIIHGHNLTSRAGREVRAGKRMRDVISLDVGQETLVLWPNPYAPFFGDEELRILSTLTALSGIAFDRARLAAQELAARESLERANELKSNFVALAAHELRTPSPRSTGSSRRSTP